MENYRKLKLLGRGSEGTVGLYRRLSDDKNVVLKEVYLGRMTKDDEEVTSNEVKVLSMLNHPNIIKYYDSFFDNDTIIIVMEYASGGTLHDYLKMRNSAYLSEENALDKLCVQVSGHSQFGSENKSSIGMFTHTLPFSFKEALCLFAQIVVGINHMHSKNILHRDLKTQNIFLTHNKQIIKMGDFGISKVMNTRSKAVSLVGTPSYLSPELCEGCPYNEKSDIWALGCILYELLSLKKAFDAPTLSGIVTKVMQGSITIEEDWKPSKCTCDLLHSLLRKDASLRPSTTLLFAHPALMTVFPKLMLLGATSPIQPARGSIMT